VTEDASLGIAQASIVGDADKLKERIEFIHEQTNSDALIEEYVEGRELDLVLDTSKREAKRAVLGVLERILIDILKRDRERYAL
jgi:D-alanine-D-alanine ligase-like ATP-grasp enzyme